MTTRQSYLKRSRQVWRAHPWVFVLWLIGLACALATLVGVYGEGDRWKYLTMLATLAIGFAHQRIVKIILARDSPDLS